MRTHRIAAGTLALALGVAALAGCSSDGPPTPDDPTLARGQEIFNGRCSGCHGADGGGGMGTKLSGQVADRYPDIEDQIAVVSEGRGAMPAFGGQLSDDDIEAVVRYTRESLG